MNHTPAAAKAMPPMDAPIAMLITAALSRVGLLDGDTVACAESNEKVWVLSDSALGPGGAVDSGAVRWMEDLRNARMRQGNDNTFVRESSLYVEGR